MLIADKALKESQIDTIAFQCLLSSVVNGLAIIHEGIHMVKELGSFYSHDSPPSMVIFSRASFCS